MFFSTLQNSFSLIILLFLMGILIFADKSFYKNYRRDFYIALADIAILILIGAFESIMPQNFVIFETIKDVLRPMILFLWTKIVLDGDEKPLFFTSLGFAITNLTLGIIGLFIGTEYPVFTNLAILYLMFALIYACIKDVIRKDNKESFFIFFEVLVLVVSTILTVVTGNDLLFDKMLGVCLCVYYCYIVGQFYKRDALTHLLTRHNMYFDMEDLQKKEYTLILIDIDNFKLINDKYGHDKGDEALATVSSLIKVCLPRGCKMYRFGGDEFVIISKRAKEEELEKAFLDADIILEEKGYSISRGYAVHEALADAKVVLTKADKEMYRNKRKAKSDDIWDVMTGLFNLRGFLDELEVLKKKAITGKRDVGLVCLDIEHLNNINTTYGYLEGNQVIITLAQILQGLVGEGEFIAHLGGDEFAVALMTEKGNDERMQEFIQKLSAGVNVAKEFTDKEYTISINFSTLHVLVDQETELEKEVDKVIYQKQTDKDNRRKSMSVSSAADDKDYDEKVEKQVLDIIDNNKLRYAFQPIVSAKNGEIVAYEALMRSNTEPMISPLTILQYASRNNRHGDIQKHTFFNVLEYVDQHIEEFGDKRVFVNSIPGNMMDEKVFEKWTNKYHHLMDRLVIEITEQRELEEHELEIINVRRSENGFSLAIDDFGSGCSNTNSLLRYMPEVIKLDRLLISGINRNSKKQYFINSIVMFAKQNAMSVLAEGVETEEELKTLIRLGVDYIQGYYTARPNFDVISEIDEDIKKAIVDENIHGGQGDSRKVYIAGRENELSLVHLALEEYTGLTIAVPSLILNGGFDYVADMNIKIKDGMDCELILRDVNIHAVDNLPCIELGENVHLTMYFEGSNMLKTTGIYVPESSSITIYGNGKLVILAKGHICYGIGSRPGEGVGEICLKHSGVLEIQTDGEECIAIGGGTYHFGKGISIEGGRTNIRMAAIDAVGVGSMLGDIPINMVDFAMDTQLRVSNGCAIGSLEGMQNICLANFELTIDGNGANVSGVGSAMGRGGKIDIQGGTIKEKINGQNVCLIGAKEDENYINIKHARISLHGEGDRVFGIGNFDEKANIQIEETTLKTVIFAANGKAYGAKEENVTYIGDDLPILRVNEAEEE